MTRDKENGSFAEQKFPGEVAALPLVTNSAVTSYCLLSKYILLKLHRRNECC